VTFPAAGKDRLITLCWLLLAIVHASPAAVLFRPSLINALYGIQPASSTGLLLVHRGGLFLAIVVVSSLATFSPGARRAASLVVGISIISFLMIYSSAGAPEGPLRTIAVVDVGALLPLAVVLWSAWLK
jgi:hypothetical protein